ncbi:MAG: ATP-binding protein, partial [Spirochaetales bacterium]|nr:ATP-binding protein [Spirochaetales bacterium]
INLNRFLENRLSSLREERDRMGKKEVEIQSQYACVDGEDQVITDRDRLKRIVDSLLSNALKFTDRGYIKAGYRINRKKKALTIYVKDSGRGISPQKIQIIFKSFRQVEEGYSREYGGIGLGLAISKKIAGQLGGDIDVQSRPAKGSTFNLRLPYNSGQEEEKKDFTFLAEHNEYLRNKWALLVDKNKFSRETLVRLLKLKGVNWMTASDLEEARRICRENPEIDLALINRESIEEDLATVPSIIRSFHKGIPCLLVGNALLLFEKEQYLSWGYRDIITRPIEPEQLYQSLIECFQE